MHRKCGATARTGGHCSADAGPRLPRAGQDADAAVIEVLFQKAWARADVQLSSLEVRRRAAAARTIN